MGALIIDNDNNIMNLSDTQKYPVIEVENRLQDIFLLDSIPDHYRDENFKTYNFNGLPVPRVSEIIKTCTTNDSLINWATRLGMSKMRKVQHKATYIGTSVHKMIEYYLDPKGKHDPYEVMDKALYYQEEIQIAFDNLASWYKEVSRKYSFHILGQEEHVVCPYYGGTFDCLAEINGAIYVIDFKTSKVIRPEYISQTVAYMWAINNGYYTKNYKVNGIGIVRADKEKMYAFEDLFLNLHIPYQREMIHQYTSGFGAMLNMYYYNIMMNNSFKEYRRAYDFDKTIKAGGSKNDKSK